MSLFELLACYGLTFGLMNKTLWLQNRSQLASSLLSCSYCTGFHSGWIIYLISHLDSLGVKETNNLTDLVIYSFASASFCYILDIFAQKIED
jgi:hypothetical protein